MASSNNIVFKTIVEKYASKTRMGMIPNMKKTNQDSHIAVKDLAGVKGLWFFGVMDGHGINGHHVSDFVKKYLPMVLANLIEGGNGYEAFNTRKSLG
jgi:serine/threonine protein phosphatase PrpC